jgi:hypothetical protein
MPDGEANVIDDRMSSLDTHEEDRIAGKDRMRSGPCYVEQYELELDGTPRSEGPWKSA